MPIFPFKKEEKEVPEVMEKEKREITTPLEKGPGAEKEREAKIEGLAEVPTITPSPPVIIPAPTEEVIAPPKIEKSPTLIEIEKILSENLDELYFSLEPTNRFIFKQKGKETASKIEVLIQGVKINIKKILNLIKEWLLMLVKMIPGVNKFFLIQEAKIKTDKILNLMEREGKK